MILVLLRHGEKSHALSDHEQTYLSPNGHLQAKSLANLVANQILPSPTHLIASEIERTNETLQYLANHAHLTVLKKKEFDLQNHNETSSQFRVRVKRGLHYLESFDPSSVVYCCSHQDWLYEAISLIHVSNFNPHLNSWPTGRYLVLDFIKSLSWNCLQEGRILW